MATATGRPYLQVLHRRKTALRTGTWDFVVGNQAGPVWWISEGALPLPTPIATMSIYRNPKSDPRYAAEWIASFTGANGAPREMDVTGDCEADVYFDLRKEHGVEPCTECGELCEPVATLTTDLVGTGKEDDGFCRTCVIQEWDQTWAGLHADGTVRLNPAADLESGRRAAGVQGRAGDALKGPTPTTGTKPRIR